jgi:hypothetical protein
VRSRLEDTGGNQVGPGRHVGHEQWRLAPAKRLGERTHGALRHGPPLDHRALGRSEVAEENHRRSLGAEGLSQSGEGIGEEAARVEGAMEGARGLVEEGGGGEVVLRHRVQAGVLDGHRGLRSHAGENGDIPLGEAAAGPRAPRSTPKTSSRMMMGTATKARGLSSSSRAATVSGR